MLKFKKWSGPNRTSRTARAAPEHVYPCMAMVEADLSQTFIYMGERS